MRSKLLSLLAATAIGSAALINSALAHDVGDVQNVKNAALGTAANAAATAKHQGDPVSDHEMLETKDSSRMWLRMIDGSKMVLGANSKAQVAAFDYDPTGSNTVAGALITVPLGSLRYVS